ncbi:ankyrin repeat-containing domain protein [Aspergillus multicolor]|uniref:ankyrin repeat-containing domain protein n=1 Tax=Aspergillus multicolor TaxID=41759 RepID=UPI003CCD9717
MSSQSRSFDVLPFDIIQLILLHVSILDYHSLKLAGNRRLTELIQDALSRFSRTEYLDAIAKEDAREKGLPEGVCRKPMEILIERGRPELALYYKTKYQHGRHHCKEYDASQRMAGEKRSYALALQWAAYYGQEPIVELLIDRVNLRSGESRRTALHYAAIANQVGTAALLLRHGAYVNASDDDGKTPLAFALEENATEVAEVLRAHGGLKDWPTILKTEDWARYIRDWRAGATKLSIQKYYITPAMISQCWQLKACLRYYSLRRTNAPPRDILRHQKHILCLAFREYDPCMVQFVLDEGWPVNEPVSGHLTALQLAATWQHLEITRSLLERGADPNVTEDSSKQQ